MNSLQNLCLLQILHLLDLDQEIKSLKFLKRLCKYLPHSLHTVTLKFLVENKMINDGILLTFLNPSRFSLNLSSAITLSNSVLKQISYRCLNLNFLNLSKCTQVNNSVIREVLMNCVHLEDLRLDYCNRISDGAFDVFQSKFKPENKRACQSLIHISLSSCNQITGKLAGKLNENCKSLLFLNLSQCKQVKPKAVAQLFNHRNNRSLDLSFIEINDEPFLFIQSNTSNSNSNKNMTISPSPLERLALSHSVISDVSLQRMDFFRFLIEIRLQWCKFISDKGISSLVKTCPKLRKIDLMSCKITDSSLISITKHCKYLKELDVSWCQRISDQGICALVPLNSIEDLRLVWCSQLSNTCIKHFKKMSQLKELHISGCFNLNYDDLECLNTTGVKIVR